MRDLLGETWKSFNAHEGNLFAGAIAYSVLLAIAPIGVVALFVLGKLLGEEAARGELVQPLEKMMSREVAEAVSSAIDAVGKTEHGALASIIGTVFFVLALWRVFETLRATLNHVWAVRPIVSLGFAGRGLDVLERRLVGLGMLLVCGLAMTAFVVLRAGMLILAHRIMDVPVVFEVLELVFGVAMLAFVFAFVYRWVPDARITWRDALRGAVVTAVLTSIVGRIAGAYISSYGVGSAYGAAGSIIALLLWIYNCALFFVVGAVFTSVWAKHRGREIEPLKHAVHVVVSEQIANVSI
jgi:membrane protein